MQELDILIADDNPDDVFLLREAFRKAGVPHGLQDARDGIEALMYLKGENGYADRDRYPFPDVLLLDLNMPRMNGFELLEWIRQDERCRRLVVYVLTASPREADVRRAYELGVNNYVIKPGRLSDLVAFAHALELWHRCICLPAKPRTEKPLAQQAC